MNHIIITGASRGLGEGLAMELASKDNHLICIARGESQALRHLAAARNCQVDFILFDLAFTQDIPAMMDMVFEKIDMSASKGIYLVNNAGIIRPVDRIENCEPEDVDLHMRVNLMAPMIISSAFIRLTSQMKLPKRIMHISSGAAASPYYGWSAYCTGKAGIEMFSQCIAAEQQDAEYPVESMAVAPGIIDTDMQTAIRGTTDEQFIHRKRFVELKESGQLAAPSLAGKHLARLLLGDEFKSGGSIDIRDRYTV